MLKLIFIPIVLLLVAVSLLLRLIVRSLWNPYGLHRPYFGPYGYYGYGRGYRRHRLFGRGFLTIAALVALDRILRRRW
jgi:hypothetical protein